MQTEKRFYKEIGWLLLIKLCLIITIRFAFFSTPHDKKNGISTTSAHLLGASTPAFQSINNKLPEAP